VVSGRTVRVRFTGVAGVPEAELRAEVFCDKDADPAGPDLDPPPPPPSEGTIVVRDSPSTFQEIADRDPFILVGAYADFGYLEAHVAPPVIRPSVGGEFLDVVFAVQEGTRFRVGRVDVHEVDEAGQRVPSLEGANLTSYVHLAAGEWFSRRRLAIDLAKLRTFYKDHGYANVDNLPQPKLDPARGIVDVVVPVKRGPRVRLGKVRVVGKRSPTVDILALLPVREGDLYSETKLQEARRLVLGLGPFSRVVIVLRPGTDPSRVDVAFEVTEKP